MLIRGAAEIRVRVFFEADRSRVLRQVFAPLGQVPQGNYLCCFASDAGPKDGDRVLLAGKQYEIGRVEPMLGPGGRVVYYRALCRQRGGAMQ